MLVTVSLLGKLGELFGYEWELAIRSPAEAIRAIAAQAEGFVEYLSSSHNRGMVYQVLVDEQEIDEEQLLYPVRERLSIVPIIAGAGAVGKILGGLALVALSIVTVGIIGPLALQFAYTTGIALISGGIVEALSPQEKATGGGQSYLSDGSQIARAYQGQPVPVLFGSRFISPVPISVWVDNENIPVDFVF